MATQTELFLYPVENEFIGKISITASGKAKPKTELGSIIILDRSSSMGQEVQRFVLTILPLVLRNLQYSDDDVIYLITFDSNSERFITNVGSLGSLKMYSRGATFLAPGITELSKTLDELQKAKITSVRLLTISDGEIYDTENIKVAADSLTAQFGKSFDINSQAVRLFTSGAQPDTTALSSLLQLNNVKKVELLDLNSTLSEIELASEIVNLFKDDNLTHQIILESQDKVFKKCPWLQEYTNKITVFPGDNIFWMDKTPNSPINIDGIELKISVQPELDLATYEKLLQKKMKQYMTQIKILKVVNTNESTQAIGSIVEYFHKRENYILNKDKDVHLLLNDSGLRSRMEYLKTLISRRNKMFSMRMSQIANDEKVSQFNAAQRADYLRTVDNTKLSRGLARRALEQGIDFNETVRNEVKKMAEHINELKNIDDSKHEESFYSKAKTIEGIRTVCELVNKDYFEELDVNHILMMINFVGIPCSSPIGDYPDPMTWRVNELHYGWYVSLSDILTAHVHSNGEVFKTPATNKQINNVIPILEERKISQFLRKYAPSLLEYSASIGMRRVIAEVPMTCGYTICAAIWKMIEDLNKNKTELHLKTFQRLVLNYEFYVGGYFKHILPYIKEQNNNKNSYYIANNGTTNMISPFITIYRENDSEKLKYIPDILRALYTYEVWQAIRRLYKNRENSNTIIEEMLKKLLGIEEKYKTPIKPLYEAEPNFNNVIFHDQPNINETYLEELTKNFYYVDLITLIPQFFSNVIDKKTEKIAEIPQLTEKRICEELDISYNLKDFKLYNIIQALLFTTKQSRIELENVSEETKPVVENGKMKIVDLKYEHEGRNMVEEYIRKYYTIIYLAEAADKKKKEENELATFLVESILKETSRTKVVELMRDGVKRGAAELKIKNTSSLGFQDLKKKLLNQNDDIPLRCNIIRLFLLGRDHLDEDKYVWNNGNINFVYNLSEYAKIFEDMGKSQEWDEILVEYKRGLHTYREKENYHGHGNSKPSYYAFGYPSLQHYKNNVSPEEFQQYCAIHTTCCGVPKLFELLKKTDV